MNVSTTIPTTVQIRRGHLIGLLVAAAALAAAITWLLVAFAFDSERDASAAEHVARCRDAGGRHVDWNRASGQASLPTRPTSVACRDAGSLRDVR